MVLGHVKLIEVFGGISLNCIYRRTIRFKLYTVNSKRHSMNLVWDVQHNGFGRVNFYEFLNAMNFITQQLKFAANNLLQLYCYICKSLIAKQHNAKWK